MLRFFRQIRQRLLTDNPPDQGSRAGKFSKYLLYAVGEILLVVIGILIALQVDNWNEQRKDKAKEIAILESLKISLEEDIWNHNFHSDVFEEARISMELLIDFMEKDYSYQDSLKYHFGRTTHLWNPSIKMEVFENLESVGFDIISNKNLKNSILGYYSFAATDFTTVKIRYENILSEASSTIFNTRFRALWNGNYSLYRKTNTFTDLEVEMIPNDFESLKKDDEYLYFLKSLKNQHFWFAEQNNLRAKTMAQDLLQAVNLELEQIKG